MSVQVQVERVTGRILAYGAFPAGAANDTVEIVTLDGDQSAHLDEPGAKFFENGAIRVEPPAETDPLAALGPTLTERVAEAVEAAGSLDELKAALVIALRNDERR